MRLRFKVQPYQTEAVDAVADCFAGQPRCCGANAEIALSPAELLANIRAVQRERGLPLSAGLARSAAAGAPGTPNLDVEMETGTGKTYVYIKTIMELNKRYGWSKFIVVVPSIAIREGVRASFEMTAEHFLQAYGGRPRAFSYDSRRLHELERFSSDAGIQVLIINIQAFNTAGKESRRIYQVLDDFQSRRPIDVISAARPVVIIDEPQKIEAARSLAALSLLRPLMILRYSATHRVEHNKVHRLSALDAYQQKLVKRIAVRGITVQGLAGAAAYLYLDAIETAKGVSPRARVELEVRTAAGIRRQLRRLGPGADLHRASGGTEAYRGLRIADIDAARGVIELSDGDVIAVGQATADVTEDARRRIQIREVIRAHLGKERELFPLGIKVLSLFFIDEVARYRDYRRADTRGEYARAFAAEYTALVNGLLSELAADGDPAGYGAYLAAIPVDDTHRGYFSVDKKTGRDIDGDLSGAGGERAQSIDADAYDLILRDKERLLSLSEPARFIFSHSALREGWDNPNVFVMGMLKRSDSTVSRRQEIGRGLRLCVNARGDRVDDPATVHQVNELTVVTDESYTDFVAGLQRELGASPGAGQHAAGGEGNSYPLPADGRKPRQPARPQAASGSGQAARPVAFDSADLIRRCVAALDARLRVEALRYVVHRGEQRPADGTAASPGFSAAGTTAHAGSASSQVRYDLLGELAARTQLTRRTIAAIVAGVSPATFAQYRGNPGQFITGSARLINGQLASLIAQEAPETP
ncbi:MAG TPA: DEAD/DEAH box helicase family protein [Trebonia sp.]